MARNKYSYFYKGDTSYTNDDTEVASFNYDRKITLENIDYVLERINAMLSARSWKKIIFKIMEPGKNIGFY